MPINGKDTFIYYGDAGETATIEIDNLRDSNFPKSVAEADVTTKGSQFKYTHPVIHDISLDFDIIKEKGNASYLALYAAYKTKAPIALLALDGSKEEAGWLGIDADFVITKFDDGEPIENIVITSVTAKPAKTDRAPEWVITAAP